MNKFLILICIFFSLNTTAVAYESNGSIEVEYKGFSPKTALKQDARKKLLKKQ